MINFLLDIPMQLNLSLFSFNGNCGYIEKPSVLCRPRRSSVDSIGSYQIDLKVLSGQFLCQDREPTFVDIQMYGQTNKRYEYRIRAKGWNGFRAIYDDSDVELGEFSIRFSRFILPEITAIRFSVIAEDGAFLGQSFIPIAYLRPGYRHIVLRNQINVPVNSSSLFVFIRKTISMNNKDQELLQLSISESCDSNNEINLCEDSSSNMLIRCHHHPSTTNYEEIAKKRNSLVLPDETSSYSRHVIAGSELNDKKRLCKVLSLNDIHPDEVSKRDKMIQNKLRRISMDYQSVRDLPEEISNFFSRCRILKRKKFDFMIV
jgi:phosphatidylinositol phospholipase C beta